MSFQEQEEDPLDMNPERGKGGADFDDLGSGATSGYGATDADAVGRGDAMDDDAFLGEEDDDNTDPIGDEDLDEAMDNDTTSAGRQDF